MVSLRAVCPADPPHPLNRSTYDWDEASRQYGHQVGDIHSEKSFLIIIPQITYTKSKFSKDGTNDPVLTADHLHLH